MIDLSMNRLLYDQCPPSGFATLNCSLWWSFRLLGSPVHFQFYLAFPMTMRSMSNSSASSVVCICHLSAIFGFFRSLYPNSVTSASSGAYIHPASTVFGLFRHLLSHKSREHSEILPDYFQFSFVLACSSLAISPPYLRHNLSKEIPRPS